MPYEELLEIDRYAWPARSSAGEILAHYQVYEFHPVVAKLQLFCSEDLGGFTDVLKDRLYTTAPKSLARRSAQTALFPDHPCHAALDGAVLSFTAEEGPEGVRQIRDHLRREVLGLWCHRSRCWTSGTIRAAREAVNKEIEALRADGKVGASLQAEVTVTASGELLWKPCAAWVKTSSSCSSLPQPRWPKAKPWPPA